MATFFSLFFLLLLLLFLFSFFSSASTPTIRQCDAMASFIFAHLSAKYIVYLSWSGSQQATRQQAAGQEQVCVRVWDHSRIYIRMHIWVKNFFYFVTFLLLLLLFYVCYDDFKFSKRAFYASHSWIHMQFSLLWHEKAIMRLSKRVKLSRIMRVYNSYCIFMSDLTIKYWRCLCLLGLSMAHKPWSSMQIQSNLFVHSFFFCDFCVIIVIMKADSSARVFVICLEIARTRHQQYHENF